MPEPADELLIRDALRDIVAWDEMARSPQLVEFLTYIVEKSLAGQEDSIKAYAIAVDVFNRPPSFDPQSDPIVRVQGGRLRRLLARFYAEGRNRVPLAIEIPTGRYVPKYVPVRISKRDSRQPDKDSAGSSPNLSETSISNGTVGRFLTWANQHPRLCFTLFVALPILVPVVLYTLWQVAELNRTSAPPAPESSVQQWVLPTPPVINIGVFENITGEDSYDQPVAELPLQLAADFARFDDLIVRQRTNGRTVGTLGERSSDNEFTATGVVRQSGSGVEFTIFLTSDATDEVVWSITLRESALPSEFKRQLGEISRRITSTLGSIRGPLHADATAALSGRPEGAASNYVCLLLKYSAEDNHDFDQLEQASACFENLIAENPQTAIGLAGWAGVEALRLKHQAAPGESLTESLFEATQLAVRARDLMPQSSFVRSQLARVYLAQKDRASAREEYVAAITRNPSDLTVRAEFAMYLGYGGQWDAGEAQMDIAIENDPSPPPWFYTLRAINNLRRNAHADALSNALVVAQADPHVGDVLALSAAPLAARADVVERLADVVAQYPPFQKYGIVPWLSRDIMDESVLDMIGYGLTLAGLPPALVQGPFAGAGKTDANQLEPSLSQ